MKSLSILLVSAFFTFAGFAQNKADSPKAVAILNQSRQAYTHLKSYYDSGIVITDEGNHMPSLHNLIFHTFYKQAGDFDFEYYEQGNSKSLFTINRSGKTIRTWWGITGKEETPPSMFRGLGAMVGVSSSSSFMVPSLLLTADFKNYDYYMLKGIAITGEDKVNGKSCYKVKGQRNTISAVIWIDKQDYLIRKIETQMAIDPAKIEDLTRKDIAERKAKGQNTEVAEKALKNYQEVRQRNRQSMMPRLVKQTYLFSPVINTNINPVLLRFRPNRVAGS